MTKKSLFFSPSLQTATLAGIGFLSLATTFTAFTTISKNQTFSNYFESLNLNQKIKDFFPKTSKGISSTFSQITSLWSKVTKNIPGLDNLTNLISPVWEKTKTLFSGIIPGFKTIWGYMQQGWGYLGTAWEAVYNFVSTNMKWEYLLIFPGSIYFLIKYFPDISKTVLEFIKSNLKKLWIFRWMFKTLKKWLGGPIETAKKWWNSLKVTVYKLGYKWTKTALESDKGWTQVKDYITSWTIFQDTVSTILKFFKAYKTALANIDDTNRKKITDMFLDNPEDFIKKLKALMTEGKTSISNIDKDNIADYLGKDVTTLKTITTIEEVTEKVKEIGKEAIKNIASGIKNLIGSGSSGSEGSEKSASEKAVEAASKATESIWTRVMQVISTVAKGAVEGVSSAIAGNSAASGSEAKKEEE